MSAANKSSNRSVLHSEELQELIGIDTIQLLKCGICWEFYENPIVLPCGHTFCYDCLLEMGRHARKNKTHIQNHDLQIACPNCRQPIKVIALTMRQVTNNYTLQSLLETLLSIPYIKTEAKQKKMVDACTNTKSDPLSYTYNSEILDDLETDVFNAFKGPHPRDSVIYEANDEIEKIRQEFKETLQSDSSALSKIMSPTTDTINKINKNDNAQLELEDKTKMSDVPDKTKVTNCDVNVAKETTRGDNNNNLGFDPAILSYSITPQTQFAIKRQGLLPAPVLPVGLGGWMYTRQTVNF